MLCNHLSILSWLLDVLILPVRLWRAVADRWRAPALDAPPPRDARAELRGLDFGGKPRYLAVIDFECNCGRKVAFEIVEFPVVVADLDKLEIVGEFQTFVRPEEHPALTGLCRRLTGIRQSDVDEAPLLVDALAAVDAFLKRTVPAGESFAVAADGPTDFKRFLHKECLRKRLACPAYYYRWVDVSKHLLMHHPDTKCTLVEKVLRAGLVWVGEPHRGIDDARNITNLALHCQARAPLFVNDGGKRPAAKGRKR